MYRAPPPAGGFPERGMGCDTSRRALSRCDSSTYNWGLGESSRLALFTKSQYVAIRLEQAVGEGQMNVGSGVTYGPTLRVSPGQHTWTL